MNRDDLTAAIRYPNLFGLTNGTVSGNLLDWPLLPVEARAALAEIDRLTAPDPTMTAEPTDAELIAAARASIDRLRDYARESTEELPRRMGMDFRERDRHVMAIHAVIDRLEGFPAELAAARREAFEEAVADAERWAAACIQRSEVACLDPVNDTYRNAMTTAAWMFRQHAAAIRAAAAIPADKEGGE